MTNTFHGPSAATRIAKSDFSKNLDEGDAASASVDVLAEFGIERDRSLQQE